MRTLQPLREFEVLLIICAIIFLSLLLLGIGCSYYCLKKRNIKVVRRRPTSTLGSDVTKVSDPVSMFGGLKIPRAHAVDASGSEEMTESIRTDFHSDIASLESEEEYTSAYSDKLCVLQEGAIVSGLQEPPHPGFDISMLVKNNKVAFTPAMSSASSESGTMLNAQEQYLTTILERTETNTLETLERIRNLKSREEKMIPVHARLNIKNKPMSEASGTDIDTMSEYSKDGTELFSEQELEIESRQMKNFSIIQEEEALDESQRYEHGASGNYRTQQEFITRGGDDLDMVARGGAEYITRGGTEYTTRGGTEYTTRGGTDYITREGGTQYVTTTSGTAYNNSAFVDSEQHFR